MKSLYFYRAIQPTHTVHV